MVQVFEAWRAGDLFDSSYCVQLGLWNLDRDYLAGRYCPVLTETDRRSCWNWFARHPGVSQDAGDLSHVALRREQPQSIGLAFSLCRST